MHLLWSRFFLKIWKENTTNQTLPTVLQSHSVRRSIPKWPNFTYENWIQKLWTHAKIISTIQKLGMVCRIVALSLHFFIPQPLRWIQIHGGGKICHKIYWILLQFCKSRESSVIYCTIWKRTFSAFKYWVTHVKLLAVVIKKYFLSLSEIGIFRIEVTKTEKWSYYGWWKTLWTFIWDIIW